MARNALWIAGVVLLSCVPRPAAAQNFLFNSAETLDQGNFKLGGYPVVLFGDDALGEDNTFGVAGRFGYGFTPSLDVEAKVALFDGFKMYGADAEYWLVKGPLDVSVNGGFHLVDSDAGVDSKAIDLAGIVSGRIADRLDAYGGLSVSFESLNDVPDSSFKRVYLVPGLEYKLHENVDLVAEFGLGLTDESPNYFGAGISFYIR